MEREEPAIMGTDGRGRGMELIEANPVPEVCVDCEKMQAQYWAADDETKLEMERQGFYFDCGACEHGGERFIISRKDKLVAERKLAEKAVKRLIDRIVEIDNELESME